VVIAALELRGVTKRFVAGWGSCVASADVLRGVSVSVSTGESLALAGPSGAGKSTLLLCAAGLLCHDGGEVRWFGDVERSVAAHRVNYYCAAADLLRSTHDEQPSIQLLDLALDTAAASSIARWIERRCDVGDAVIVATHDEDLAHHLASRVVVLRGGRLFPEARSRSRVAEYAPF
jgi:ABC-type multidrug transport system ATPase subunit